jgi:hypothetical protein
MKVELGKKKINNPLFYILFRGDCVNASSLVDQIIYIAWFWFIGHSGNTNNLVFFLDVTIF